MMKMTAMAMLQSRFVSQTTQCETWMKMWCEHGCGNGWHGVGNSDDWDDVWQSVKMLFSWSSKQTAQNHQGDCRELITFQKGGRNKSDNQNVTRTVLRGSCAESAGNAERIRGSVCDSCAREKQHEAAEAREGRSTKIRCQPFFLLVTNECVTNCS